MLPGQKMTASGSPAGLLLLHLTVPPASRKPNQANLLSRGHNICRQQNRLRRQHSLHRLYCLLPGPNLSTPPILTAQRTCARLPLTSPSACFLESFGGPTAPTTGKTAEAVTPASKHHVQTKQCHGRERRRLERGRRSQPAQYVRRRQSCAALRHGQREEQTRTLTASRCSVRQAKAPISLRLGPLLPHPRTAPSRFHYRAER